MWLWLAVVVAFTAGVYWPALDNEFVHDDWPTISENQNLRGLGNLGRFFSDPGQFSKTGRSSQVRPVLLTTFALNFSFSEHPRGFRLVNLALHLLNILLAFLLVVRIASRYLHASETQITGLVAASIFALHPLNTQAVIYVSSRSTLLMFSFYIAAVLAYLTWREKVEKGEDGRAVPATLYLLFAAGALLTKENAVSLAGIVILLEIGLFQARRRDRTGLVGSIAAGIAPVLLFLAYRSVVLQQASTAGKGGVLVMHSTAVKGPYFWQLATQVKAQLTYLWLFLWPADVAIQHSVSHVESVLDPGILLGLFVVLGGLIWALPRWWRGGAVATAVLWYLCASAPEMLVRLNIIVNEHRFYLPGLGLIAICSWLLVRAVHLLSKRSRELGFGAIVGVVVLVLALGARSRSYAMQWKTACTLWEYTVTVSPDDSWTQNNVGNCRLLADDLAGAETAYRRAIDLAPENYLVFYNLGLVYERLESFQQAIEFYEKYEEALGAGPQLQVRRAVERLRQKLSE